MRGQRPVYTAAHGIVGSFIVPSSAAKTHEQAVHRFLCVGHLPEQHPLVVFKKFAIEEHENFLLAANLMCLLCGKIEVMISKEKRDCSAPVEQHSSGQFGADCGAAVSYAEQVLSDMMSLCTDSAWVAVGHALDGGVRPDETDPTKRHPRKTRLLRTGLKLLQTGLTPTNPIVFGALLRSAAVMGHLLGAIDKCNSDIEVVCPANLEYVVLGFASPSETQGAEADRFWSRWCAAWPVVGGTP